MNKSALSAVMFACGALSLTIAVYQFAGSRVLWGILSLVYSVVFLAGGLANRRGRDQESDN